METKIQVRSFDSPLSPEDFSKIPRRPVYAILDNLRSAFNVGSIIRTADCALMERIYLCGITAHPPHKKLDKTSLGSMPYVPWAHKETLEEAVTEVRNLGARIVALELTNQSKVIWDYQFALPTALILGNEALGVSREILKLADDIVEIPMFGYKNSLNVAVAFGIAAYEIQRQFWNCIKKESRIQSAVKD
jgi:23S rRNA (guanosine2251-2'-O)-methyltransferase